MIIKARPSYIGEILEIPYREEPSEDFPCFRLDQDDTTINDTNWDLLVENWRTKRFSEVEAGLGTYNFTHYTVFSDHVRLYLREDYVSRMAFENLVEDYRYHNLLGGTFDDWYRTITLDSAVGIITAGDHYVKGYGYDTEPSGESHRYLEADSPSLFLPFDNVSPTLVVTDAVDRSTYNHGVAYYNHSSGGISTTQYFTNGSSLYSGNDYARLLIKDHSSLQFGTGDFTIEGYIRPEGTTEYNLIMSKGEPGVNPVMGFSNAGNTIYDMVKVGDYIWFTDVNNNRIRKYNPATNQVDLSVTVGTAPNGIEYDGSHLWVCNYSSDSITKVDPTDGSVVTTISLAATAAPRFPTYAGGYLWVPGYGLHEVYKINVSTNAVVATITGVTTNPCYTASDGTYLWVTCAGSANVRKINMTTNALSANVAVGNTPTGIRYFASHIWVANYTSSTISKIDPGTDTVVTTLSGGNLSGCQDVEYDGTYLYVANYGNTLILQFDIVNNIQFHEIMQPQNYASNYFRLKNLDGELWVTGIGAGPFQLLRLTNDPMLKEQFLVAGNPTPAEVVSDGTYIWVLSTTSANARKFDPNTNQHIASVAISGVSYAGVYLNGYLWVGSTATGSVEKIDVSTNTVVATVAVTHVVTGLCTDGTYIYASCGSSAYVKKIDPVANTLISSVLTTMSYAYRCVVLNGYLYVTGYNTSALDVFDLTTFTVVRRITGFPGNVNGITTDGTYLWVTSDNDARVHKVDPSQAPGSEIVKSLNVGFAQQWPFYSNGIVWIPCPRAGSKDGTIIIKNDVVLQLRSHGGAYCGCAHGGDIWIAGYHSETFNRYKNTINVEWGIHWDAYNQKLAWIGGNGSIVKQSTGVATMATSTWNHFVIQRRSGKVRIFIDGLFDGEVDDTTNYNGTGEVNVGANCGPALDPFYGYLDSIKITKNYLVYGESRRWGAGDPEFTVKKNMYLKLGLADQIHASSIFHLNFEATHGTSVFRDEGPKRRSISQAGPVTHSSYLTASGSSSAKFTASLGSYLTVPDHADLDLGTGDFTLEFWFFPVSEVKTFLFGRWPNTGSAAASRIYGLRYNGDTDNITWLGANAGVSISSTANGIKSKRWHHIAVVREAGVLSIYVNFTLDGTGADATDYVGVDPLFIGHGESGTYAAFDGYLDQVSFIKGTALYSDPTINYDRSGTFRINPHRIPGSTTTARHRKVLGVTKSVDKGRFAGFRILDSVQKVVWLHTHALDNATGTGSADFATSVGSGPGNTATKFNSSDPDIRYTKETAERGLAVYRYEFGGRFNP
jgi:streptogramin lyase